MSSVELLVAGLVLLVTVGIGTVVHELLHATCLRAAGVPFEIEWLHGGRSGPLGGWLGGTWASVRMTAIPETLRPWQLRVAALSPLLLAASVTPIAVGLVPDPFVGDDYVPQALVLGWLACALPSPADFSLVWYASTVIDEGDPRPGSGG